MYIDTYIHCASTEHLDECLCLEINSKKLFEHAWIEESVGETPLNSLSQWLGEADPVLIHRNRCLGLKVLQKTMLGGMVSRESTRNQMQTLYRGRAETTTNERIRRSPWQWKTGSPESSRTVQVVTKIVHSVTTTKQTVVQVVTFDSVRRRPSMEPRFNYFCSIRGADLL